MIVLAVAAIAMAAGWLFGESERVAQTQEEAPLIKADAGPDKVRPEDPGGMQVPNRDMLVYRRLEGDTETPPVERLLPNPEQPVVPPRPVSAPGREIAVTDAMDAADAETAAADEKPEVEAVSPPAEESRGERIVAPEPPQPASAPPEPAKVTEPKPAPVTKKPTAPAPSPAPALSPDPASGAYQVQLVAVRSRDQAQASWGELRKKHADVLSRLKPNIVRADLGAKGVIYRLRAGPAGDETRARAICTSLAKRKVDCVVVRPSG